MTDSSLAYPPPPAAAPRAVSSPWTPGVQLMRRLLHGKLPLLWLSLLLPVLLPLLLLVIAAPGVLQGWFDWAGLADARAHTTALALLGAGVVLSLYLMVCAGKALSHSIDEARGAARQQELRIARSARELAEARVAMQLHHEQIRAAIDEAARRIVALCGMLDADRQDAERAAADLEAIQDEERSALQLMAALRARLLALAHRCRGLEEAARHAAAAHAARGTTAADTIDELSDAVSAELTQCHQFSERIGGAERLNERRIESMRRSTDRLQYRAERGMAEGHQLMVLTRQVQAALAASLQRLQQLAALAAPGAPSAVAVEAQAGQVVEAAGAASAAPQPEHVSR